MECQCQRLADVNKCSGVQRLNELQTSVNDTVDKIVLLTLVKPLYTADKDPIILSARIHINVFSLFHISG